MSIHSYVTPTIKLLNSLLNTLRQKKQLAYKRGDLARAVEVQIDIDNLTTLREQEVWRARYKRLKPGTQSRHRTPERYMQYHMRKLAAKRAQREGEV